MADNSPATLFDPWRDTDVVVRDIRPIVAPISDANSPSAESVQGFLDHRSHLVQDVDITGDEYRVSALIPPPRGIGVGVYFKQIIVGFENVTTMYWWIVAPEYLGGPSHSLVYLTSSNQAAKGPEALVEYFNQAPAMFRIWDWASPPQFNGSRFVVNLPFATWGTHHLPITIDSIDYRALYIANRTSRVTGDEWVNDVFVYDGSSSTFDHTWRYRYFWVLEPSVYFGWGPIVEPFKPYDFKTTNPVGYAKARLLTDRVDAIMTPKHSKLIQRNIGFETLFLQPNHTLLAT